MISVIIPMYNEESNAKKCIQTLNSYLSTKYDSYEIIAVNDGSNDKTEEIICSLVSEFPYLKPFSYKRNQGKGYAVRTGVTASHGDILFCTDCDLAYGCDVIGSMTDNMGDAEILIGSRNLSAQGHEGYTLIRKLMSKLYIKLLNVAAAFDHSDSQCGIKCYKGDVARKIFSLCQINGFAFDLEVLMIAEKLGMKINEFPVKIINHAEQSSKVRIVRDSLKMLSDLRQIKKNVKALDLTNVK